MNKILSLVIPSYNEERAIDDVLGLIAKVKAELIKDGIIDDMQVLVINDGSEDNTAESLKRYDFIEVIEHERSCGYGYSLKEGFKKCHGEWVAFLDMDMTYDPKDLRPLLEIIQSNSCKIVFGSRWKKNTGMPLLRKIGNSFFTFCVQLLYMKRISDVCTGFRIFHRSLLPQILSLPQHNLNYSIAMTLMSLNNKITFDEFSIRYSEREGRSKLNEVRDGLEFLKTIFQYWIKGFGANWSRCRTSNIALRRRD
jgi:glycosyltransferase involved in cell wall biosynthesis